MKRSKGDAGYETGDVRWGMSHSVRDILIFILIFACGLFITINSNVRSGKVRYRGKIWSDAAHYYVYLPATFIYHWEFYRFPYRIDKKFDAFLQNEKTGKIEAKTTCGEAILLTPFFLAAHASAFFLHKPMDGFSSFYQVFMLVGCVFYFTLALFLLKRFLDRYFTHAISLLAVLLPALCTQVFFYAYDQALMSHTYSFFVFSAFLYLLKKYLDGGKRSAGLFVLLSLTLSLAILIRPTNIMIVLWIPFLDLKSARELWQRILFFLNPKRSLVYILVQFIVLIPQFMYWKYLSGHYVYYSYPGEVFFWDHPMLLQTWFSPFNGLFLYHPVFLVFIAGMLYMIFTGKPNGIISLLFFLIISYVFSCWHCWFYGGSFGFRPMAEFAVFMALPLGFLLAGITQWKNLFLKSSAVIIFLMFIYINLMQFYHYQIFTAGMWSWDDFWIKLKGYEIVDYPQRTYEWKTDFSNIYGFMPVIQTNDHARSRLIASYCNHDIPENVHYKRVLRGILDHPVHRISMSLWVYPADCDSTHAQWVCRARKGDTLVFSRSFSFDKFANKRDLYSKVYFSYELPGWVDQDAEIDSFIFNPANREFYFDDMSVKFE